MRIDAKRVREASSLEDLVVAFTGESLHPGAGGEKRFRCAVHGDGVDEHPSGRVNLAKQVWFCDVCRSGGDAISFVMRYDGCGFRHALSFLADRAGITRGGR